MNHASPDHMTEVRITKALRTTFLGHPARYLPSTASTNIIAHKIARDGANDGTLVITDYQTHGRGRLDRQWLSPPGADLLFSLILRPALAPAQAFQITAITSLAVAHAIRRETGLDARIKWPNDIYIRDKKTSGILTELAITGTQMAYAVTGIGINVNSDPALHPELQEIATSLRLETGRPVDRLPLLTAILEQLEQFYGRLKGGEFAALKTMWDTLSLITGRQITIATADALHEGVAESVDDDGTLIVRDRNGSPHRFVYGDVSLALRK
jgi:BirA family biotin operon repressor/biotin-[acetyl-CoA-carboxylase] ligase